MSTVFRRRADTILAWFLEKPNRPVTDFTDLMTDALRRTASDVFGFCIEAMHGTSFSEAAMNRIRSVRDKMLAEQDIYSLNPINPDRGPVIETYFIEVKDEYGCWLPVTRLYLCKGEHWNGHVLSEPKNFIETRLRLEKATP